MNTKRPFRKLLVGAALAVSVALGASSAAFAATPTGSDGTIQTAKGAGSDTTYPMMQRLEALFNGSPGCTLDATTTPEAYTACAASQPATVETRANYDHDIMIGQYPSGSSAGITKVLLGQADYARSSRAKKTDGSENSLQFAAYAKDGLAVVTFSGREGDFSTAANTPNLTIAQLATIFGSSGTACTTQDWSSYVNPATGLPFASAPIRPYGLQTQSGTYSTMKSLLGVDPNNCPTAIQTAEAGPNRLIFENNTAPIDGGTGTDGTVYASPAADRANAIWWMSFGDYLTSSNRAGTAKAWNVNGVSPTPSVISSGTYPLTRLLYHVMPLTSTTATSGTGGAVRVFRDWLCRGSIALHATDITTGLNYNTLITNAINASGFIRMPSAQGNNGERCFSN